MCFIFLLRLLLAQEFTIIAIIIVSAALFDLITSYLQST